MAHRWHLGKHIEAGQLGKHDAGYEYTLAIFDAEGKTQGHFVFNQYELQHLQVSLTSILTSGKTSSGAFENE